MNERIRELAEQAGCSIDGMGYGEGNIEKFAELIIQECSKVNNQFIGRRIGEIDLDMVYKEHFGVEQ